MNETYSELYNKYDGSSDEMLKYCLDYTNKELRAGKPGRIILFMFRIYRNSVLLENSVRKASKEIYREKLSPKAKLTIQEFGLMLDPEVKELMNQRYHERSPFWPGRE